MKIYKCTNKINGKIYIGQTTKSITERMTEHQSRCKSFFEWAILEYGIHNFVVEEIQSCSSIKDLNAAEQFWISRLSSNNPTIGYNSSCGGGNGRNKKLSTCIAKATELIVLTQKDFSMLGVQRQLVLRYKKSGFFNRIGHGVYSIAGSDPSTYDFIRAAQRQSNFVLTGESALLLHGKAHNIPLGKRPIFIRGVAPAWLSSIAKVVSMGSVIGNQSMARQGLNTADTEQSLIDFLLWSKCDIELCFNTIAIFIDVDGSKLADYARKANVFWLNRVLAFTSRALSMPWEKQVNKLDFGKGKYQLHKGGKYLPMFKITIPSCLFDFFDSEARFKQLPQL